MTPIDSTDPPHPSQARSPYSAPILGVSACLIENGAVLLQQRHGGCYHTRWSLPGGKVEIGETLAVALHRELREETELHATIGAFIDYVEILPQTKPRAAKTHYLVLCFAATAPHARQITAARSELCWLPLTELDTLTLTPGLKTILTRMNA